MREREGERPRGVRSCGARRVGEEAILKVECPALALQQIAYEFKTNY